MKLRDKRKAQSLIEAILIAPFLVLILLFLIDWEFATKSRLDDLILEQKKLEAAHQRQGHYRRSFDFSSSKEDTYLDPDPFWADW